MKRKTLIANTHDIYEAFIANGLHQDYSIYCQFPHCAKLFNRYDHGNSYDIEFNDGHRYYR